LTEVFQAFKGFDAFSNDVFFTRSQSNLGGHSLNITKRGVRLDFGNYFFSKRRSMIRMHPSDAIIECNTKKTNTLIAFKKKLDHYYDSRQDYWARPTISSANLLYFF